MSAVNFGYLGFDTLGEELIVPRRLRGEREKPAVDEAADRDMPPASKAARMAALAFTGPLELPAEGQFAGAVSSGGTIPLISFFVGLEVAAAFILHGNRDDRGDPGLPGDRGPGWRWVIGSSSARPGRGYPAWTPGFAMEVAFAAASLRNSAARPKVSPMVRPAS